MKFSQRKLLVPLLLFVSAASAGCGFVNHIRAKNALNEGARAYKEGRFDEAQKKGEEVLALHPVEPGAALDNTQRNALLLTAYSIQQQYKGGIETPENLARARAAIDAYKKVLEHSPDNDLAYNQVAVLYGQLKEEDKVRDWLMQRANMENAPKDKRAEALVVLASKQWKCAYDITENLKQVNTETAVITYKKPEDPAELERAQRCIAEGTQLSDKAIELYPDSPDAWSYRTNLLRERAKLAQIQGNAEDKKRLDEEADKAEAIHRRLTEEAAARKEAEAQAKKSPQAPAS